jgi:hypothetical protein
MYRRELRGDELCLTTMEAFPLVYAVFPNDPDLRCFSGAPVSKANSADYSLATITTEVAASGRRAALAVDMDGPETAAPSTALAVVPVNPEPVAQGAHTDLYRRATQRWDHLKQTARETWEQYIVIGEAMVAARGEIMRKLGRNDPTGPAYQREFKAWLVEYRLADMDKAARARLIKLIDALPEVNEMLADWSDQDRRKRNHPNTIYRALQNWRIAQGQPPENCTKKPTGTSRKEIFQESDRFRAHIGGIEAAGGETISAATAPDLPEPTDIVIEANRSAGIEIVNCSRKKMTPSTARRRAERAERKRRKRLEYTVSQISLACENNEEWEFPTLTATKRDAAVAQLEASASDLNKLIGRLKAVSIHK